MSFFYCEIGCLKGYFGKSATEVAGCLLNCDSSMAQIYKKNGFDVEKRGSSFRISPGEKL